MPLLISASDQKISLLDRTGVQELPLGEIVEARLGACVEPVGVAA